MRCSAVADGELAANWLADDHVRGTARCAVCGAAGEAERRDRPVLDVLIGGGGHRPTVARGETRFR